MDAVGLDRWLGKRIIQDRVLHVSGSRCRETAYSVTSKSWCKAAGYWALADSVLHHPCVGHRPIVKAKSFALTNKTADDCAKALGSIALNPKP